MLGSPLQLGLSWDFDGDWFTVVANPAFVELSEWAAEPPELVEVERGPAPFENRPPHLDEVQAHFLRTFPGKDRMGIYHSR